MGLLVAAARNAGVNAITALVDAGSGAGKLVFRNSGGTVLATLTMSDPAFASASSGSAAASAITAANAVAAGTAAFCDVMDSSNVVVFDDLTVGVTGSGSDIEFSSVAWASGDNISVSSFTFSIGADI